MTEKEIRKMRKSAIRTSRKVSKKKITREWGKALKQAVKEKTKIPALKSKAELNNLDVDNDSVRFNVEVTGNAVDLADHVLLFWEQQKAPAFGRLATTVKKTQKRFRSLRSSAPNIWNRHSSQMEN